MLLLLLLLAWSFFHENGNELSNNCLLLQPHKCDRCKDQITAAAAGQRHEDGAFLNACM